MNGLAYYSSPVGELEIQSESDAITMVAFLKDNKQPEKPTPVIQTCLQELDEYFFSGRKFFDVTLKPIGSSFQQKVWSQLLEIPYGKTTYYADIAGKVGDINSVRAVALPMDKTPLLSSYPVIG